jgi:hypothetical protein
MLIVCPQLQRHTSRNSDLIAGTPAAHWKRSFVKKCASSAGIIVAGVLLSANSCLAQHVLYSQKQDKTAQDALAASKEIISAGQFDKMLHNLDNQAIQESDTALAFTKEEMRSSLAAIEVWRNRDQASLPSTDIMGLAPLCKKSVRCTLELIQNRLTAGSAFLPMEPADIANRLMEIHAKSEELKKAVAQLQAAAKTKDPAALQLLSHLGNAKDLIGYGQKIQKLTNNAGLGIALGQVSDGLDELIALYNTTKGIWDGYTAVDVDISALRPTREAIQLKALALEEDHLKTLTRLRANEALEVGDQLGTVKEAIASLKRANLWESDQTITKTLQLAAQEGNAASPPDATSLRTVFDALMLVTALIAPSDAAVRLGDTRESDEYRRYSLRLSALNTSTYDTTVQNALQRLAIYYKSGLKPSDLAQLIFYVTNSVSVPVIATK